MLVDLDRADFLDEVVVIYLIKKVLNLILYQPFENIKEIDIDDIVIPRDRELITKV